MATLSYCSSLTATTLSHKQSTTQTLILPHSKINLGFLSPPPLHSLSSSLKLTTSSPFSSLSFVPNSSEIEAAVVESEPVSAQIEPAEVVETAIAEAKPEQVFAVVVIGSRQYIVFPGRFLYTQRLKGANVNDKIILNKVLLVGTKTKLWIGYPVVTNAAVHAVVEEHGLNDKVVVFKYKKKKNYRRNIGHRQPNTRIRIVGITGYENTPYASLP
ncbi:hypothetical protein LguiA_004810 [Lonicera macranthoides]